MKKLKAKKNQDLRVPQLNASRKSQLTQRIHLDGISSLARNKKGVSRESNNQSYTSNKKNLFSCQESSERMCVTKTKPETKEVKLKENKKIN